MDLDRDLAGLRQAVEVHTRDGDAQQLLALAVGCRLGVLDRGQILGQRQLSTRRSRARQASASSQSRVSRR